MTESWLEAVIGDPEISQRLNESRTLADMIAVEAAYSRALGHVGQFDDAEAEAAARAIEGFQIDHGRLAREATRDGMPVPSLSHQLREAMPDELKDAVHSGLTSQDVMDSALLMAVRDILVVFENRLENVEVELSNLNARFGDAVLMGRTRMQAALPMKVGDRIAAWTRPLITHRERLSELRPRLLRLQLGGPVGTRESFGKQGSYIARHMAEALGLYNADHSWHTDRSSLAELAGWLSSTTGSLGKIGHDLALMALQGVDDANIEGGGQSSAMAHKANPVRAETLMALSRYNAIQLGGMHLAMDHEQERSGAAWTLEWLILPGMLKITGAALLRTVELLKDVEALGKLGQRFKES